MGLADELHIKRGITAVIGSGGKTTLLARLAAELPGTVILTTTTHILPFEGIPTADGLPLPARVSCIGTSAENGKLAAPACGFDALAQAADYVLVEADGSRSLPLKAHAAWEPVIPVGTAQTILVVGASGFGNPVRDAVHRPEIFCQLACCMPDDLATPQLVARVICAEALADRLIVNQADKPELQAAADQLAALVGLPAWIGSLLALHAG